MKKLVRDLIVGKKRYFDSWTEYRQVMLSGQFGLIAIAAMLVFVVVDLVRNYYFNLPIFGLSILILMLTIRLHRLGHHCLANSILYPSLIILIYLFLASESPDNGGLILFVPIVVGAFASFDYKHRKLAVMVAMLACFMFLAATYIDFTVLEYRQYSQEETLFNMLLYFIVAVPTSVLAISMMIRLNHRNAKQLLETNRMLKKSNEELDRFIYSTSHDLRAPLSSVLGLINLSEKTDDIDVLRKYLGMMTSRVNALEHFIKDITDYSRNNRTEVSIINFNLHQLATEIWDSLKYCQKAEHISFQMDFDQDMMIESDPHRLRIILSNLISNAIRYHDSRKENRYIKLSCKRTEKSFILNVEDNGQGIAPEYHKSIFQMFFRANESSTGSGLGLYIVNEAIDKLSGQLQLQSAVAQGSTFTVKIPTA
jgi:signal transduction histidine kinase